MGLHERSFRPDPPVGSVDWARRRYGEEVNDRLTTALSIAEQRFNVFRNSLLIDPRDSTQQSEFGLKLDLALNNASLTDHNFHHSRRLERVFEATFHNIDQTHEIVLSQDNEWLLDAGYIAINFHDVDQLLTLQRNEEGEDLNSKKG